MIANATHGQIMGCPPMLLDNSGSRWEKIGPSFQPTNIVINTSSFQETEKAKAKTDANLLASFFFGGISIALLSMILAFSITSSSQTIVRFDLNWIIGIFISASGIVIAKYFYKNRIA